MERGQPPDHYVPDHPKRSPKGEIGNSDPDKLHYHSLQTVGCEARPLKQRQPQAGEGDVTKWAAGGLMASCVARP